MGAEGMGVGKGGVMVAGVGWGGVSIESSG